MGSDPIFPCAAYQPHRLTSNRWHPLEVATFLCCTRWRRSPPFAALPSALLRAGKVGLWALSAPTVGDFVERFGRQADERLDHVGIELLAREFADLLEGVIP